MSADAKKLSARGKESREAFEALLEEAGKVVVRPLIRRGPDVNTPRGPEAQTPIHMAARRGNLAIARVLLDGGADLEARDKKGETPLRRAVNCGHPEFVSLLLAHGADVNARDDAGKSMLVQAAQHPDVQQVLREAGAR